MPKQDDFLNLDEIDAEANLKPYVVRIGGNKIELPNFGELTGEQLERFDAGERREVLLDVLPKDVGPGFVKALWSMKGATLNRFLNSWARHGGASVGEGSASASS